MSKAKSASRNLSSVAKSRLPARTKLMHFAEQLRALATKEAIWRKSHRFPPSISDELVEFIAGGIEKYLKGECQSLDRAFGLARGRGKPKLPFGQGKNFELAKKIFWLQYQGLSWKKIGDQLDKDPRELQRILDRYRDAVMADLLDALKTADK